jgi:C_GCAxxG_C_C family probable redox protein
MNRKDYAKERFSSGYNCAQAVAMAFTMETGLDENLLCTLSTAFGGGGGRRQFCCGAVSGALLVISLLKGRGLDDDKARTEESYALAREFFARFEEANGSSECRVLLDNANLQTAEGQERFKSENMKDWCIRYVQSAVSIVEELLDIARNT